MKTKLPTTPQEVLLKAERLIAKNGWFRCGGAEPTEYHPRKGKRRADCHCMTTAVGAALRGTYNLTGPTVLLLTAYLKSKGADVKPVSWSLMAWNDQSTEREVRKALREASKGV